MLLVLPMCPGEDCSAAAALSCFQYFALEHQVLSMSFRHTVKWLKLTCTGQCLVHSAWEVEGWV